MMRINLMTISALIKCKECNGTGKDKGINCWHCNGSGRRFSDATEELRDKFAMASLMGLLNSRGYEILSKTAIDLTPESKELTKKLMDTCAKLSYECADQMMKAREE